MRFNSRQAVLISEVSLGILANDGPSQTCHVHQNPMAAWDWTGLTLLLWLLLNSEGGPLLHQVGGVSGERGSQGPGDWHGGPSDIFC